ncbi:MAG: glycosyltransferase family 39 protein, partial [Acidobacteriota bacterium]
MSARAIGGLFLLIAAGAAAIRLGDLDRRPMHHDEANQAIKFGALLEKGEYRYDPEDHHGPSLYYLTVPAAWLGSERSLADLTERTLRSVPALSGVLTILLFWLLRDGIGARSLLWAAILAALSPAMVYYSRFYIQETLLMYLVIGAIGAGWRYAQRPGMVWAATAGVFAGAAAATKETWVVVLASASVALLL